MTQLGQHVRTKRYQVVCTRRRKVHGDFKLRYPEKVVKRKRTSKRSKDTKDDTTCEKIDRTLRFSYQQKITQKVSHLENCSLLQNEDKFSSTDMINKAL